MHITSLAPVLSATFNLLCIWIMATYPQSVTLIL
jgi:hypothetical protein